MNLLERIESHEGFSRTPYIDPLVAKYPERYGIPSEDLEIIKKHLDKLKLTFGYGFTFIDKDEAEAVLELRLQKTIKQLKNYIDGFDDFPVDVQQMLAEMAYQMGVEGVSKFRKMLQAIRDEDWCTAFAEGKDSRWYMQTPGRALAVLAPLKTRCEN